MLKKVSVAALAVAAMLLPHDGLAQVPEGAVVSNPAEDTYLAWAFVERFRLGGQDEGPEAFFTVSRRVVAADTGTITVLDADNHRIVQFDANGEFLRTFGGEGEGPGEFSFPVQLSIDASGPIAVYDLRKRALVRYSPIGEALPQIPLDQFGLLSSVVLAGDSLIYETRTRPTVDRRPRRELRLATPVDTLLIASLDEVPSTNQEFRDCGVRISLPPVFAPSLLWRYGYGTIVANVGPDYAVSVATSDGTLSVQRNIEVRPATQELAERELGEGMPLGVGGPSATCLIPTADLIEQAGMADYVPAIRDLTIAPNGAFWVQRWTFKGDPQLIDVFNADGVYLGTLRNMPFPIAFLPDGEVITVDEDDLGIQRLVVSSVTIRAQREMD